MPGGTYKITHPLRVKSGITVRGDGMIQTVIKGSIGYIYNWLIGFEDTGYDWDLNDNPDFI